MGQRTQAESRRCFTIIGRILQTDLAEALIVLQKLVLSVLLVGQSPVFRTRNSWLPKRS